jgi:hypothetical protein
MSTILESPPQVTTAPPRVPSAAPPQVTPPTTRRRTVAIVVAVVAAIAALIGIGVAVWWVNQPTTTTTAEQIYIDPVPHPGEAAAAMYAARNTELFGAFGPASTVYTEQVPALAAVSAVPETFGYGSRDYQAYLTQLAAALPLPLPQASPWSEWPPPTTSANVVPRLHQAAPFEWTTATVVPPPHQAAPFEYVTVPGPTVVPRLHQAAPFE